MLPFTSFFLLLVSSFLKRPILRALRWRIKWMCFINCIDIGFIFSDLTYIVLIFQIFVLSSNIFQIKKCMVKTLVILFLKNQWNVFFLVKLYFVANVTFCYICVKRHKTKYYSHHNWWPGSKKLKNKKF